MRNFPKLHIHSPLWHHDCAFIVGDRESLQLLKEAINSALTEGNGKGDAFTSDGEGFQVHVYNENDPEFWDKALLPYAENAIDGVYHPGAIGPWDLFKKYNKKK